MKKQRMTSTALEERRPGQTDWVRLKNMSEEELHQAALDDPDAQPTTAEDWQDARIVRKPRGPKPGTKNTELKIRFRSVEEKERIMAFISRKYPEMSITGFVRLAAREKIERES